MGLQGLQETGVGTTGGSQAQCWVDSVEQLARAVGMVTAFGGLRQHGLEIQPISDFSPTANPSQYQRHLFVHISQHCPSPGAPPLESVDVRQIYDKFPEKKGGLRELYDRGPPHAFFLVKFWVSCRSKTKSAHKSCGVPAKASGPKRDGRRPCQVSLGRTGQSSWLGVSALFATRNTQEASPQGGGAWASLDIATCN